jgi:hypothetical protein
MKAITVLVGDDRVKEVLSALSGLGVKPVVIGEADNPSRVMGMILRGTETQIWTDNDCTCNGTYLIEILHSDSSVVRASIEGEEGDFQILNGNKGVLKYPYKAGQMLRMIPNVGEEATVRVNSITLGRVGNLKPTPVNNHCYVVHLEKA